MGTSTCSRGPGGPGPSGWSSRPAAAPSTASPTRPSCRSARRTPHRPLSPYGVSKKAVIDYLGRLPRAARPGVLAPWPWPTSTGPARTPTARRGWWPSSPSACWTGCRSPSSATASRPATSSTSTTWSTPSCGRRRGAAAWSCNIGTGRRDLGQRALPRPWPPQAGVAQLPRSTPRPGPASSSATSSTSSGRPSSSAGGPGPSWPTGTRGRPRVRRRGRRAGLTAGVPQRKRSSPGRPHDLGGHRAGAQPRGGRPLAPPPPARRGPCP